MGLGSLRRILLNFIPILLTFNPSRREKTTHWSKNPHDTSIPSCFLRFQSRCVSRSPSLYRSSICLLSELYVVSHWNGEIREANIWPPAQVLTPQPANALNTDMYNRPRSKRPLMVFGRYGRLSFCCLIGLQKSSLEGNKTSKGQTQCNYKSEYVTRAFVKDPLREREDGGGYSCYIHIAVLLWTSKTVFSRYRKSRTRRYVLGKNGLCRKCHQCLIKCPHFVSTSQLHEITSPNNKVLNL